jgi:hypothetical protein
MTLGRLAKPTDRRSVEQTRLAVEHLRTFENPRGGWAHYRTGGDVAPTTFATYLSVRAEVPLLDRPDVVDVSTIRKSIQTGLRWLASSQHTDGGWGFSATEETDQAATALAVLAILEGTAVGGMSAVPNRQIPAAVEYLLTHAAGSRGVSSEQKLGGNATYSFHYFTPSFVLCALLRAGQRLWQPEIWAEFAYLLSLRDRSGGWADEVGRGPNVWATYAAIECLRAIRETFEPNSELLGLAEVAAPVFAVLSLILLAAYASFWRSGMALDRDRQLIVHVAVLLVSFTVAHMWSRQVFQLNRSLSATIAVTVSSALFALDLARV